MLHFWRKKKLGFYSYSRRIRIQTERTLSTSVTYVCCHLLRAYLGKIPRHYSVVESVEHAHESCIHPGRGFSSEYKVEPQEGCHHGKVSEYAGTVADLVD